MAKIAAARVETSDSEYEKKQVVRVQSGLYGGMFAWYSLPKMYPVRMPKPGKPTQEEKFYVGFIITHDRTGKQLPHFSDAMTSIRTKLFYDETTGMKSGYVGLIHALSAGKLSLETIAAMNEDDLPDFDDYIGRPVWLFIEANQKPGDDGLYGRRVKGLEPMDNGLWAEAKALYNGRKTEETKAGVLRLVEPCAAYEEDAGGSSGDSTFGNDDPFGEDPFGDRT